MTSRTLLPCYSSLSYSPQISVTPYGAVNFFFYEYNAEVGTCFPRPKSTEGREVRASFTTRAAVQLFRTGTRASHFSFFIGTAPATPSICIRGR